MCNLRAEQQTIRCNNTREQNEVSERLAIIIDLTISSRDKSQHPFVNRFRFDTCFPPDFIYRDFIDTG